MAKHLVRPLLFSGMLAMSCAHTVEVLAAQRTWEGYTAADGVLEIRTSDGRYIIKPYSPNIIETTFIAKAETPLAPVFAASHAVVMPPQAVKVGIHDSKDALEYTTGGIAVTVSKSPFQIAYTYKGKPLLAENEGYVKKEGVKDVDFGIEFRIEADESLYGGGARALGLDRRGNRLRLYNKAHYGYETKSELMNYTMPLVLSSKLYAVHFDNPAVGWLDLDSAKKNVLSYEASGGRKTYQVIADDSWEGLIGDYTALTGRQPMPPRWAFGNFASRFGYHSEAEARAVIDKFRAEKIPVDAIVFDLYWFGADIKGTMGNLAWHADRFPTPQKMIADFAASGVKTILITEPFVLTTSKRWDEAVRADILAKDAQGKPATYDFYFGHTGLIDIFGSKGRDWFWNIYRDYAKQGVAGWWGDLGEPEVHPAELRHATGTADDVHNIYGHAWAKLLAEGYAKEFPDQRPFILMRSGYSGSQRFGMIPWSGDVNRTWGGLQSQPEIALEMGMQGIGYMHSDLGGFANPNLDDELYARWLQYGVFQPIFRPHAQEEVPSEPVFRADSAKALAKAAIELRYRLLPYNYTLAFDNNRTGMPLMRPMLFEEPDNPALRSVSDTYLWGRDFLVAPILQQGQKERKVYFPATGAWFDFHSGERHAAGSAATLAVAADHIPVFVRAGAFIPMAEPVQTTRDYSTRKFDLHYYHDASVAQANGKLYDDDGSTRDAYDKGKYALLRFGSRLDGHRLDLTLDAEVGRNYADLNRTVTLHVHNVAAKPKSVTVDNAPALFTWDDRSQVLSLPVSWPANVNKQATIILQP
jgi:alpha-glucosidase (family GH31 glycosyl hydrolase)